MKGQIEAHFDNNAPNRTRYFHRNHIYHEHILQVCCAFLKPGMRVLELGSSTGDLLASLLPEGGVGVDISRRSVEIARSHHPKHTFIVADAESLPTTPPFDSPFDMIIMSDIVAYLDDVQTVLSALRRLTHPDTYIVISLWNWIWRPLLQVGEMLHLKAPDLRARQNWLSTKALTNLLDLTDYAVVEVKAGLLMPFDVPIATPTMNALTSAPLLHPLALLHTIVARPLPVTNIPRHPTVTVVIPTRNEAGNVEALVDRVPEMGAHTELLFIDGNSTDGTVERIHEMISAHPERDIRFMPQVAPAEDDSPPDLMLKLGKGDAVRKAFAAANGEVLMILDSDISVLPEELPKFYFALATGKARFINGTRFNYPQQDRAMRPLNMLGNVGFSVLFSWLLGQRITDTLCGTKVMYKRDYEQIAANRSRFGDFDPFGDFDLLFGAAWLGLPVIEVPVHYQARTYGESKVRVSLHGPLLARMSLVALWHFKIRPLIEGRKPRVKSSAPAVAQVAPPLSRKALVAVLLLAVSLLFARPKKS